MTLNPNSLLAVEHNSVVLTCKFAGNPVPFVIWERNGVDSLPVETRRSITTVSMANETVKIHTVSYYVCMARRKLLMVSL